MKLILHICAKIKTHGMTWIYVVFLFALWYNLSVTLHWHDFFCKSIRTKIRTLRLLIDLLCTHGLHGHHQSNNAIIMEYTVYLKLNNK